MIQAIAFVGAAGLVSGLILTPVVRNVSVRLGLVDRPDGQRKLHQSPIPRTGGVAVWGAYLAALGLGMAAAGLDGSLVGRLAGPASLVFVLGLWDDTRGLGPWGKLAGQMLAAVWAWGNGVVFSGAGGWIFPEALQLPLTVGWLVFVTNAMNLIDGMDGLAAGVAVFATVTMLVAGLEGGHGALLLAVAPLTGALLGFLRYNFNPASVFLGDCGSLPLGFLLGCFGLIWSQKSATVLGVTAPILALAIPLLDSVIAVVRRFLRRQPIFGADRGHLHHRLLERGVTVRQAALLMYGVALVFSILSLGSWLLHDNFAGVVLILFGGVTWIGVQSLGYVEVTMAGRLMLGRGFRQMLAGQLTVRQFEAKMQRAGSGAEVWAAVWETARELGFDSAKLRIRDEVWEGGRTGGGDGCWMAEVPLPGGGHVRLTRPLEAGRHEAAMAPFVAALRRGLLEKITEERPGRVR